MKKVSFLVPAHNEEKIIAIILENLLNLPYSDYEVIIGLDGCTDNTENIVKEYCKKSKKFTYYSLNLRKGKPAVINYIIKKAKGEIIIINDADWIFKIKNKQALMRTIEIFNDAKVGGIAESFPVEWDKQKIISGNIGYKMTAYSSKFWFDFQKKKFSSNLGEISELKESALFMTNIFRKELYKNNTILADDFERTAHILKSGYKVVFFNSESMPRMTATYSKIFIKDIIKQKIRTATARKQFKQLNNELNSSNYYIPAVIFILSEGFKKGIKIGSMMIFWAFIMFIGTSISLFKNLDTQKGWNLRMRR